VIKGTKLPINQKDSELESWVLLKFKEFINKYWIWILVVAIVLFVLFAPVHCYQPLCKPGVPCPRICESIARWLLF